MANKSRPKKTRGTFYKKYVYGAAQATGDDSDDGIEMLNSDNEDFYSDDEFGNSIGSTRGGTGYSSNAKALHALRGSSGSAPTQQCEQKALKLPLEIIIDILELTPNPTATNHLLICRAIYWYFLPKIYAYPALKSQNLLPFLEVVSGDNAASVRGLDEELGTKITKLALKRKFQDKVTCLDLSTVVQSGKNSYMSKLLRRTCKSLEIFISSQSSFGAAPLVSLKSCINLRILDLRLVSETVNLVELFKSLESLPELEQLCFPRSSVLCNEYDFKWPTKLWYLRLQGAITDTFASNVRFPPSIENLELAHCPNLTSEGLDCILSNIGINLRKLSITYPMPKIGEKGADRSFWLCPNLTHFVCDIAYISWELFSEDHLVTLEEYERPLRSIIIESTGYMGMCDKLSPNDITVAVDENLMPNLQRLGLNAMLGWDFKGDAMDDMVNELEYHNIEVYKF